MRCLPHCQDAVHRVRWCTVPVPDCRDLVQRQSGQFGQELVQQVHGHLRLCQFPTAGLAFLQAFLQFPRIPAECLLLCLLPLDFLIGLAVTPAVLSLAPPLEAGCRTLLFRLDTELFPRIRSHANVRAKHIAPMDFRAGCGCLLQGLNLLVESGLQVVQQQFPR